MLELPTGEVYRVFYSDNKVQVNSIMFVDYEDIEDFTNDMYKIHNKQVINNTICFIYVRQQYGEQWIYAPHKDKHIEC